jgi:hypothetical protein
MRSKEAEHRFHEARRAEAQKIVDAALQDVRDLSASLEEWARRGRGQVSAGVRLEEIDNVAKRWRAKVERHRAEFGR